ncbi:hypothetical protein KEM52_005326, partial [Ascosphaera acerosa]
GDGADELLVLGGDLTEFVLEGGALGLCGGDVAAEGVDLSIVLLLGGELLLYEAGVGGLDLVDLLLQAGEAGLEQLEGGGELALAVGEVADGGVQVLVAQLEGPVLVLVALLGLVEDVDALGEGFGLELEAGLFEVCGLEGVVALGEEGLQLADLGEEGGGDFGNAPSVSVLLHVGATADDESGCVGRIGQVPANQGR